MFLTGKNLVIVDLFLEIFVNNSCFRDLTQPLFLPLPVFSTVTALARWSLIGQFVAQGIDGIEPITELNNIYIWLLRFTQCDFSARLDKNWPEWKKLLPCDTVGPLFFLKPLPKRGPASRTVYVNRPLLIAFQLINSQRASGWRLKQTSNICDPTPDFGEHGYVHN